MEDNQQIINKKTAVSIGLVMVLISAAFYVGSLDNRIDRVEDDLENTPSREAFDILKDDVQEIKIDVKSLLTQKM